jgi:hypothetical protein
MRKRNYRADTCFVKETQLVEVAFSVRAAFPS